jgi:ubiquinol-cytochrome c reductase iron-sulfur subunit
MNKRRALAILVSTLGLLGVVLSAAPFVQSMMPSSQAENAAIQNLDVFSIKPGSYKHILWQGKPVIVFRPNSESIQTLESLNAEVWGPPITGENASFVYVYEAISTNKGCGVRDTRERSNIVDSLPSGWFDPCHAGVWDYAGRSFIKYTDQNGKKLANLKAVQYRTIAKDTIQIYP